MMHVDIVHLIGDRLKLGWADSGGKGMVTIREAIPLTPWLQPVIATYAVNTKSFQRFVCVG